MKIGIAGPLSLEMLDFDFKGAEIPEDEHSPIISMLINGLLGRGHKVVAYTTSKSIQESIVFADRNLTICIAPIKPHPGRYLYKNERKELLNLMRKYPVDIINAHWSYEYAWAAIDSRIPTIVSLRDHATTILKYQFDPYRIMRWIMNFVVLKKAKYLTTNSQYLFNLLSKQNKNKAIIINNFFAEELKNHFDSLPAVKKNYILTVASGYNDRKNINSALLAFSIVRKKFPHIEYYLIGKDMEEGGPAYEFAQKHSVLDGVVFKGFQPYSTIPLMMKEAKVLLHPAREESFGMTIIESLLAGTIVVAGQKSGNIPFLLTHKKTGLLCDIDNPQAIANNVIEALTDSSLTEKIQSEGYTYALTNFSENKSVSSFINYYEEVLALYHPKKLKVYKKIPGMNN